jgi:apolipoprotein N-acyltransferase
VRAIFTRIAQRLARFHDGEDPRTYDAVVFGAGLVMALAFAPFGAWPLALASPAILFLSWRTASPGRAAWRGLLFGVGLFGLGVSWVYVSMHEFGNMPLPLAAFATFLFVVILSLYLALFGYVQARVFNPQHALHPVLVLPAMWVLFEWWRSWFLSGFPWLNLGYSQVDTPLVGYAAVVGVYGVSFVVALSAGLFVAMLLHPARRVVYLASIAAIWAVGFALVQVGWVTPAGAPLRAVLVQGNIPLSEKWNPRKLPDVLKRYRELTFAASPADLVLWPEAAIPALLHRIPADYLPALREYSREHRTDFLIGVLEYQPTPRAFYNTVVTVGEGPQQLYRKQHLVPFGEYVPLRGFFSWLMRSFDIPMSELAAGASSQGPLRVAGHEVGISVCYEDAFGEEVIRALPNASLLANVSEDAWFGASFAPHQRMQMARMRAIEAGRPMLRAANTGPSAAIDHRGRVTHRSEQFEAAALAVEIQPMQGSTPYARTGNPPIVVLLCLSLAVAGWRGYRARTGLMGNARKFP